MLVDSHCHLDFPDFAEELDDVITRAGDAGIGHMVSICTHIRKFDQIRAIAERYDNVFCSVGTHPHNADQELDFSAEDIAKLPSIQNASPLAKQVLTISMTMPRAKHRHRACGRISRRRA